LEESRLAELMLTELREVSRVTLRPDAGALPASAAALSLD
jgi:hypothetical protein